MYLLLFFAQAVGDWLETGQVSGDTQTGDICFQLALIGVGTLIIDQAFSNLPDDVYNEYVKIVHRIFVDWNSTDFMQKGIKSYPWQ